jgi:hypothetical protein
MRPTANQPIVIRVSSEVGVSNGHGRIVRVVGDNLAYVGLDSGEAFAFSAKDIVHYGGQSFRRLGVHEGASVSVTSDPSVPADVSVHFDNRNAEQSDSSLVSPEVEEMINAAVKGIPAEVWEAIGLAQKTVSVQPVEYGFSHVGACDAFESRH